MLAAPRPDAIQAAVATTAAVVDNLVSGRTAGPDRVEESPVLAAMLDALAAGTAGRRPIAACAVAAVEAAGEAHFAMLQAGQVNPEGGEGTEPPVTDLLPMLEATGAAAARDAADPGMPASPVSADAMRLLVAIELHASGSPHAARRASLAALAERDRARDGRSKAVRPAALAASELAATINRLSDRLAA